MIYFALNANKGITYKMTRDVWKTHNMGMNSILKIVPNIKIV